MATREVSEDLRERAEAMATWRWWEEHYEELLARYPERFVVIDKNREVIGAYPHIAEACQAVEKEGLDFSEDVDVKFLTSNKRLHLCSLGSWIPITVSPTSGFGSASPAAHRIGSCLS